MRNENSWINILFSVSFFVFMVFVLASGSILFMKIYNAAFEEKDRYRVLVKIGIDQKVINKAIANVMQSQSLLSINLLSVVIIYVFFTICYFITKIMYQKNVK